MKDQDRWAIHAQLDVMLLGFPRGLWWKSRMLTYQVKDYPGTHATSFLPRSTKRSATSS